MPRARCARPFAAAALALTSVACVVFNTPRAEPLSAPTTVTTPVKAHLADGSVVVFPRGALYAADSLRGDGVQYGLRLDSVGPRSAVPLDSLLGVETVTGGTNVAATIGLSAVAAAGAVVGGSALAVAIFGSCPTVYASSAPDAVMEAELFSHSIVPLAEARDVDRLTVPGATERIVLDVRNEALETHFINHLEVLAVEHAEGEWIVNDGSGVALAVSNWLPTTSVRDRTGRGVGEVVDEADGRAFSTAAPLLEAAGPGDFEDHLLLEVPAPEADSAAVVLRLRNSLLNTVLLYDFMLAPAGLHAAEWLGGTLERLGTAVEMGRWYRSRMGMRVEVWEDGGFRSAGRLSDTGPLAWEDVALIVPVPRSEDALRIRLSFVADQWRIDQVRIAASARRPSVAVVPLGDVLDRHGTPLPDARAAAASPDDRYLETRPGDVVQAVFEPGPSDRPRTFLLAAQGYYTEWLRPAWIRDGREADRFVASDAVLLRALDRWRAVKDDLEARFYESRVPTR